MSLNTVPHNSRFSKPSFNALASLNVRERALAALGTDDPIDGNGIESILAGLLIDVLDIDPTTVAIKGATGVIDGLTFRAIFSAYDEGYSLHLWGACPHCGERGAGPALGSWADLGRSVRSFRRQFHICAGMAEQ